MLAGSGEDSQAEGQSNLVERGHPEIQVEQANPCPPVELEVEVELKAVVDQVE